MGSQLNNYDILKQQRAHYSVSLTHKGAPGGAAYLEPEHRVDCQLGKVHLVLREDLGAQRGLGNAEEVLTELG